MFYQHLEFPVFKAEFIMYIITSSIPHMIGPTLRTNVRNIGTQPSFHCHPLNQSQCLIYSVLLMSLECVILSEPNVTAISSSYFHFLPDLLQ